MSLLKQKSEFEKCFEYFLSDPKHCGVWVERSYFKKQCKAFLGDQYETSVHLFRMLTKFCEDNNFTLYRERMQVLKDSRTIVKEFIFIETNVFENKELDYFKKNMLDAFAAAGVKQVLFNKNSKIVYFTFEVNSFDVFDSLDSFIMGGYVLNISKLNENYVCQLSYCNNSSFNKCISEMYLKNVKFV